MYKRKYLIFNFLCFITFTVVGQDGTNLTSSDVVIGMNLKTNTEIIAKEYTVPDIIQNLNINEQDDILTIQQKDEYNQASITLYNLSDKKAKWSKNFNYQHERIDQYGSILLHQKGNKSVRLDMETGQELWKKNYTIYQAYPSHNIGIGYKTNNNEKLEGIDLETGKSIWKRSISNKYGWNEIIPLSNSSVIISSSGLHALQIKNGRGWDYEAKSGKDDHAAMVATNILGAFFAGFGGGDYIAETNYNTVSELASNMIVDDNNHVYYASRNKIACINNAGSVVWVQNLPKSKTSKSSLVVREGIVYLINLGYAYLNGELSLEGLPFIAAFEKDSGKPLYLKHIDKKKAQIRDYIINGKGIHLLFNNKLALYNPLDGSLIKEVTLSSDEGYFIENNICIKKDSLYDSLNYFYPSLTYVYDTTEKQNIIGYNSNLEIQDRIDSEKLLTLCYEIDGYLFLTDNKKTLIIDPENNEIAQLQIPISSKSFIVGSTLYDIKENRFIEIDLNYLFQLPE